jgi:hypothetical protein
MRQAHSLVSRLRRRRPGTRESRLVAVDLLRAADRGRARRRQVASAHGGVQRLLTRGTNPEYGMCNAAHRWRMPPPPASARPTPADIASGVSTAPDPAQSRPHAHVENSPSSPSRDRTPVAAYPHSPPPNRGNGPVPRRRQSGVADPPSVGPRVIGRHRYQVCPLHHTFTDGFPCNNPWRPTEDETGLAVPRAPLAGAVTYSHDEEAT